MEAMVETILWVGISQAIFASLLVLSKKNKGVSDQILAAWLILMAIEFLTFIIDYMFLDKPLLSSSFLLINPAFYLYVKSLTDRKFSIKPIQFLHLLPFLFFETFAYIIQETINLYDFFIADESYGFRLAFGISNIISWLFYNYLSISMLNKHRKNILQEFSSLEHGRKLIWIFSIVIFYNIYCAALLITGLSVIFAEKYIMLPQLLNYSVMLFLIYLLGFYGLGQSVIYSKKSEKNILHDARYKNSLLHESRKKLIRQKILNLFEQEKPFLNPDFNMDMLSEIIHVPKHQISEVLNTELNSNFFNFVNTYRVEEVKKMLSDISNPFCIEAIGYDCGFNSKSSFFSVFKKMTGKTPFVYRKKNI
jgi:AraC-like DNA-binding protein